VSIPNWRMAHQFIYRGIWDYDNFLYFLYIHNLQINFVYRSNLTNPPYKRLDSETLLPEELLYSWNFYFATTKKDF